MSTYVEVRDLTHRYWDVKSETIALKEISFSLKEGSFLVVVGSSGCGKSTLLSILAGLYPIHEGFITIDGNSLASCQKRIGYVLQKDALLAWRTIKQNVQLGLEIQGIATLKNKQYAFDLLDQVGLGHVGDHYPHQLSGGMRQRVALARTLAVKPDLLLLDEPFSALDIKNKIHLETLLKSIHKQQKKTTILVTHDLEEAIALGDDVLVLSGHPGTVRKIMKIPDSIKNIPPLEVRGHTLFRSLFEELWREVDL
ncbi:ABC transporter ATP-binding protein [Hazenella sp. IB182353]|uniref:ABC transporter ATP-binding protein n=1 Tax=Polycladospora coralii TaxID=2771432 RepID=UPI001746811F|nr:ABC transporter ATP-binding protein [Polycladospora coralii]MBS7529263.1 ABC transporter ATP-binding protein [Polycladospora coralii]